MAELLVRSESTFEFIERNTVRRRLDTSYSNAFHIEIGDSKQPDFKPQVKFIRWSNDANFSIRAAESPDATAEFLDGKFVYKTPNWEVHQYEINRGFEFEWILPSRPPSNILTATIRAKDVEFHYQRPLTEDEIQRGFSRPPNVVGSYAVYHASKGGAVRDGDYLYGTGKVAHIYRPAAVAADGRRAWCDLNIRDGLLRVTVPQNFLDTAVYPVVVDPTFGYTGTGASTTSIENIIAMGRFDIGEDGTGTSLTAIVDVTTSAKNMKGNVYQDETGELDVDVATLTNGETAESNVGTGTSQAITFNFNSAPSFTSGTFYRLAIWSAASTGTAVVHFDTAIAGASGYTITSTYGTWPNPSGTLTRTDDVRVSVYVTYTASGSTALTDMIDDGIIPWAR